MVIAKTIKGYGMGKSGESVNTTHQTKKLDIDDLMYYRDRFDVPLTNQQVKNIEYYKPDQNSPESFDLVCNILCFLLVDL